MPSIEYLPSFVGVLLGPVISYEMLLLVLYILFLNVRQSLFPVVE